MNLQSYTRILTMKDRYTHWQEAVPNKDTTAETLAGTVFSTWVVRFGSPALITNDQES